MIHFHKIGPEWAIADEGALLIVCGPDAVGFKDSIIIRDNNIDHGQAFATGLWHTCPRNWVAVSAKM